MTQSATSAASQIGRCPLRFRSSIFSEKNSPGKSDAKLSRLSQSGQRRAAFMVGQPGIAVSSSFNLKPWLVALVHFERIHNHKENGIKHIGIGPIDIGNSG